MKQFLLTLLLLACGPFVSPARALGPADEAIHNSYPTGQLDEYGNLLGGTEFMNLVAFEGKLFGGLGYWEDTVGTKVHPGKDAPGPQVVVLDSPHSKWRQDYAFDEIGKKGIRRFGRLEALEVVTFTNTRNARGKTIALEHPISLMIAGLGGQDGPGGAFLRIGSKTDEHGHTVGNWVEMPFAEGQRHSEFRTFTVYADPITHLDRLFVGIGTVTGKFDGAIFSGYYDPSFPGKVKIRWDTAPEFTEFKNRVMSFTTANGKLYFAAKPALYERAKNGDRPSWSTRFVYDSTGKSPFNATYKASGLRGLTAITDPLDPNRQIILGAYEGVPGEVFRIDPDSGAAVTELRAAAFLRSQWGTSNKPAYALLAYNNMPLVETASGPVRLLGLLAESPLPADANSTWLLSRKEGRQDQNRYSLHEIKQIAGSRDRSSDPKLFSVRTFIVSPFDEDRGQVLYFGGYDGHWQPVRNTAWLYRGGVNSLLRP